MTKGDSLRQELKEPFKTKGDCINLTCNRNNLPQAYFTSVTKFTQMNFLSLHTIVLEPKLNIKYVILHCTYLQIINVFAQTQ